MKRAVSLLVGTLAIAATFTAVSPSAQNNVPTFTKDVAPIIFEKCAGCHRPGEVAPMTLMSYDDARPWARAIKAKVVAREMPPWGADPEHSLPMRNDRSLIEEQIDTIAALGGRGRAARQPSRLAGGAEVCRRLDLRPRAGLRDRDAARGRRSRAEGELGVQMFYTKVPFDEDRFAEVVELRPGNRAVVHHAGIFFVDIPEGATLDDRPHRRRRRQGHRRPRRRPASTPNSACPAPRSCCRGCPDAASTRIGPTSASASPPASTSTGRCTTTRSASREKDRTRLGIWFNKVPVTHEVLIRQAGDPLATTQGRLVALSRGGQGSRVHRRREQHAPPRQRRRTSRRTSRTGSLTGITPVTEDITLYAMSPHMHLRGKSLKWVITYPDGREQTILNVPKFDFNWQFNYELAEPLKIPAGSKIRGIGVYDNSPKNKLEPGAAPRGVLVRAELGRDVSAVHRVLGRQPGPDVAEGGTNSTTVSW